MPYSPVVGSVMEVQIIGTLGTGGSNARNTLQVFHYRLASIGGSITKAIFDTAFQANLVATYLAAANARYAQVGNQMRYVNDATDGFEYIAHANVGAIATDPLPMYDCVSMLYRTALRGKSYRGAKRWPAVNEADTTADILTGAGLARWQALQADCQAPIADASGNVWNPCVLSRFLSQLALNPTTVISNDVTAVLLNLNVGSMIKRKVATVR